ncbi:unnamed protein product [Auanema sp. JU1783]|nr:unnamed protein product [Auanema sp. JU1783]
MPVKCPNKSKKMKTRELVIDEARGFLSIGGRRSLPPRGLDCFEDENYFFSDEEETIPRKVAPKKKIVPSIDYLMNSIASWQWAEVDEVQLPVVIRDGIQYAAVIMIQVKLLSKFPYGFSDEALKKHKQALVSRRMTEMEACLFNCVNACSRKFNLGFHMYSANDEVVTLAEAVQFYFQLKEHFLHNLTEQYKNKEDTPSSNSNSGSNSHSKCNPSSDSVEDVKFKSSSKSIMASIHDRCREIHDMNIRDMISNEDFFTKLGQKLMKEENVKDLIPPKYCTGFHIPNEEAEVTDDLEQGWMRMRDQFDGNAYSVHGLKSSTMEHASTELAVLERMQISILKRIVLQRASRALFVKTKYTDQLRTLHNRMEKSLEDSSVPLFDQINDSTDSIPPFLSSFPDVASTTSAADTPSSMNDFVSAILHPGMSSMLETDTTSVLLPALVPAEGDVPAQADVPAPDAAIVPASVTVPSISPAMPPATVPALPSASASCSEASPASDTIPSSIPTPSVCTLAPISIEDSMCISGSSGSSTCDRGNDDEPSSSVVEVEDGPSTSSVNVVPVSTSSVLVENGCEANTSVSKSENDLVTPTEQIKPESSSSIEVKEKSSVAEVEVTDEPSTSSN